MAVRPSTGRCTAFVKVDGPGPPVYLGSWADETTAALAWDRAVLFFGLDVPLNLPARSRRLGPASPEDLRRAARLDVKKTKSSPYFGVMANKPGGRWLAHIGLEVGPVTHISTFDRAEDAAIAYDRVARLLLGEGALLNFPEADHAPATIAEMQAWSKTLRAERPPKNGYGIVPVGDRFRAFVKQDGTLRSAGLYASAREAGIARDRAVLFLGTGERLNDPSAAKKLGGLSLAELRRLAMLPRKRNTSSRYFGVYLVPPNPRYPGRSTKAKWMAAYARPRGHGGGTVTIGTFASEREAAEAYDRVARAERGPDAVLNFPQRDLVPTSLNDLKNEVFRLRKSRTDSRYVGVRLRDQRPVFRWAAVLTWRGRAEGLGNYKTERQAAIAFDRALLYFGGPAAKLNLPKLSRDLGPAAPATLRAEAHRLNKKTKSSQYRGVHWDNRKGAWGATIAHGVTRVRIGSFDSEIEAARAYDKAARRLHKRRAKPNFPK